MMRKCTKCNQEKEENSNNFHWRNDYNKFRAECISCIRERDRKRWPKKINTNCEQCDIDISYLNSSHVKYCDNCKKKREKERNHKRHGTKIKTNCKRCYCNISHLKSYRVLYCDGCRKKVKSESQKKFYENNPKLKKIVQKRNYSKNREKILKRGKEWRQKPENKIKERERHREYRKKTGDPRNRNPCLKLHHNVSCIIRGKLRGRKLGKSVLDYLPYNFQQLKEHLESQFEWWMTWDNWGIYNHDTWDDNDSNTWTWQIDHIIPRSETQYDSMDHPNFKKCWALENLRPLSAKKNVMDGVNRVRHKQSEVA